MICRDVMPTATLVTLSREKTSPDISPLRNEDTVVAALATTGRLHRGMWVSVPFRSNVIESTAAVRGSWWNVRFVAREERTCAARRIPCSLPSERLMAETTPCAGSGIRFRSPLPRGRRLRLSDLQILERFEDVKKIRY